MWGGGCGWCGRGAGEGEGCGVGGEGGVGEGRGGGWWGGGGGGGGVGGWGGGAAGASSPSIADSQAASSQWVAVRASAPDIPCTVQFLRTVAQVDRIGRRCATEFLDTKATELQARSQYRARLETTEHFTRRSFSLLYIILPHLRCAAPGRTSFLCVWCGLPCCFFPKALGGILRPRQRQWRFPVAALAGQLAIATPR